MMTITFIVLRRKFKDFELAFCHVFEGALEVSGETGDISDRIRTITTFKCLNHMKPLNICNRHHFR